MERTIIERRIATRERKGPDGQLESIELGRSQCGIDYDPAPPMIGETGAPAGVWVNGRLYTPCADPELERSLKYEWETGLIEG